MHEIERVESALTDEECADYGGHSYIRRGTKALVSTPGRVLLVKEQHANGSPFWTLPGGGADPDESLVECLTRELFEELGCRALIDEPVATIWYAHSSSQSTLSAYTVFECSLLSTPRPNGDEGIREYKWMSPSNLPSSTLPQVRQLIRNHDLGGVPSLRPTAFR